MYESVYRCKLCRKRFTGVVCNEKEVEKRMVFHAVPDHYCEDGSVGVPEFLGMRYIDGDRSKSE